MMSRHEAGVVDLRANPARLLAAIVESSDDAIVGKTLDGKITSWNRGAEDLYGYTAEEAIGQPIEILLPPDAPNDIAVVLSRVARGERVQHYRSVRRRKDGSLVDVSLTVSPVLDDDGNVVGASAIGRDITQEMRAEEANRFLSEASVVVFSTLEVSAALRKLTRLASHWRADYAITYLVGPDGRLHRSGSAHTDPARAHLLEELDQVSPLDDPNHPVRTVVASGTTHFIGQVPGSAIDEYARTPDLRRILRELAPTSSIVAPLRIRGRTLGAMTLATVAGGKRPFQREDVPVVDELARRAALAIDNARLYQEAEAANQAKTQFLRVMSHELRTPLAAIVGFADLIHDGVVGPVNQKQREILQRTRTAAFHLTGIIDGILTYTRTETGREEVTLEEIDAAEAGRDALGLVEHQAEDRPITVRGIIPDEPVTLLSDRGKLMQILLNLLTNAVKFADRGEVVLAVEADEEMVTFRVTDEGPGIPADQLERIFEPFTQVIRPRPATGAESASDWP